MSLILFVCGTNRARSPMAAAYFQKLLKERNVTDIEVASAGIAATRSDTICWEARETLRRQGLEPLAIGVTQLLPKLVKTASLIVCMTEEQEEKINSMFISSKGKVRPIMGILGKSWSIAEPPKGDLQKHIECLESMIPALTKLADVIA